MTKQQKARAHLARAQELIQDTLAFGVRQKSMDLTHAQDNTTGLKDIPPEVLSNILKNLPGKKSTMAGNVNWSFYDAHMDLKKIVIEGKKKILEAWQNDETQVLNDADLFRIVCRNFPSMFGYASEKLQFLLAKEMFDLDRSCVKAYNEMMPAKIAEFYKNTMRSRDGEERLKKLRKMYQMKLCTDFIKPGDYSDSDEDFDFDEDSDSRTEEVQAAQLEALSSRQLFRRALNREKARRGMVMLLATAECSITYYYNLVENEQNNIEIIQTMIRLHVTAMHANNSTIKTKVNYANWRYYLSSTSVMQVQRPPLEEILEDARSLIEILKKFVLCEPLAQQID